MTYTKTYMNEDDNITLVHWYIMAPVNIKTSIFNLGLLLNGCMGCNVPKGAEALLKYLSNDIYNILVGYADIMNQSPSQDG